MKNKELELLDDIILSTKSQEISCQPAINEYPFTEGQRVIPKGSSKV